MADTAREEWQRQLQQAASTGTLVKISLADPRGGEPACRRLRIRPVQLRSGPHWQFVWELDRQDLTKNFPVDEGVTRVGELLGSSFASALLVTTERKLHLSHPPGRLARLRVETVMTPPPVVSHDRTKRREVDARRPWLTALGVTTPEGAVCKGMEAKFRQIHRFVELLTPLIESAGLAGKESSEGCETLRLVDMGCGKGYLTFAAHEHLQAHSGRIVETRGVEVRPELVQQGNQVARESGLSGLEFLAGTIAETPVTRASVLMALHACNTATDEALAVGIEGGAELMLVSPCCHQEVRPQLKAPAVLERALVHGIFRERQAEFVTDALRALLLEARGYETRVFEFISPEHTAKNLMIAAVKRRTPGDADEARAAARALAAFYGITRQCLADRLGIPLD